MTTAATYAFERGCSAMLDGDVSAALRWLEQAHALAQEDASIALMLAGARLRAGQEEAAELFETLARTHDLSEAWLGLAAGRRLQGRVEDAAAAISYRLSRHALYSTDLLMFTEIARQAGAPGWCGLNADGQLILDPAEGPHSTFRPAISLDGKAICLPNESM